MTLYEYRSGPSYDLIELDDSFQPDYMAEHRELTDRERDDFRIMFLDFCAYRVHDSN
jgi:hypothetical protein